MLIMNRGELQIAREEARETIDKQIQAINDIDEKAVQIFRLDILIISLIIAASSITIQSNELGDISSFVNLYTAFAVASFTFSALLAGVTYSATSVRSGVSHRDIEKMMDEEYGPTELYEKLLRSYTKWIQQNYVTNTQSALWYTGAFIAAILAIVFLFLGLVIALISVVFWIPVVVVLIAAVVLIVVSGVSPQIRRLRRLRWEIGSRGISPVFEGQIVSKGRIIDEDNTNEQVEEPKEEDEPEADREGVEAEKRDGGFEGAYTTREPSENQDQKEIPRRQVGYSNQPDSKNLRTEAIAGGIVFGVVRGVVAGITTGLLNKAYEWCRGSQREDKEE